MDRPAQSFDIRTLGKIRYVAVTQNIIYASPGGEEEIDGQADQVINEMRPN